MRPTAPLSDSYPARAALMLLALCPNIIATTALPLSMKVVAADLGTTRVFLELAESGSDAGYAFGAVLGALLIAKRPLRQGLLAAEGLFVTGAALVATAPAVPAFVLGRTLMGFGTGLLLVLALPPLITAFGARRLPVTAALVNVGLFGAVTVGPLFGGEVAAGDAWRLFAAALGVLGLAGLGIALLSVRPGDPAAPDKPRDGTAIALAAVGTFLPFYAVAELTDHAFTSPYVLPALAVGLACLLALVLTEYHQRQPLMPVRLLAHTFPVTGVLGAMMAGAAYVALLDLAQSFLQYAARMRPAAEGLELWPNVVGLAVAAVIFGALFRTKYVPVLATAGMAVLAVAGAGMLVVVGHLGHPGHPGPPVDHLALACIAAGLGFGAGATVSPGLFLAGLAVPSDRIGPAFALVELLRSEGAFLAGPVVLHLAMATPATVTVAGLRTGAWIAIALVAFGTLVNVVLFYGGGARLHAPDLQAWVGEGETALDSPPVAAAVRN